MAKQKREHFSSRLGFILISAGCAIGLGNVWKFPYEVGQYGGAAFLILYLICVAILGIPLMTLEFSIGRAAQASNALAYNRLEKPGTKWHWFKWVSIVGQYVLMAFYTCVCGWMIDYIVKSGTGDFVNANSEVVSEVYQSMVSNPYEVTFWMIVAVVIGMIVCFLGVQKGIEKITKVMMILLLAIMIFLAIFAMCLPGAQAGLEFYLMPRFDTIFASPEVFCSVLYQALSLAFFTLSVGMGSMVIFGSYIGKERSLFGEALTISLLDVGVAIVCGLIIFPSCFAYGINPGAGPSLVFETLPNVFANMPFGSIFGTAFFLFLSFAAMSTLIAVFENIIAFWMDQLGWSRAKSVSINMIVLVAISIPCCLGFSIWSGIDFPLVGINTIMDFEDFIISNNILPLGGIVICLFCTFKSAWGWKNCISEINAGKGVKMSSKLYLWIKIVIPILILFIFMNGWISVIK